MEAILFCGIQASGKTTFYRDHFLKTHLRISLDLLKTRNKEKQFLSLCLRTGQKFVVDNTNPTKKERQQYIEAAKAKRFKVVGYFFTSRVEEAIERNKQRMAKECIPIAGIRGTAKKLEPLSYEEGFDQLYLVAIQNQEFVLTELVKESAPGKQKEEEKKE